MEKPIYINTFESQGRNNYALAIKHYENLLKNFNRQLLIQKEKINRDLKNSTNFSIEKLVDDKLKTFQVSWEKIYTAALKDKQTAHKILSDLIKSRNKNEQNKIEMSYFLSQLIAGLGLSDVSNPFKENDEIKVAQFDLNKLDKLNMDDPKKVDTNIIAIFGEFFEQAINEFIGVTCEDIISIIQTGSVRSKTSYQRKAKVKPDALIAIEGIEVDIGSEKSLKENKVNKFVTNNQEYHYELQDLINLSNFKNDSEFLTQISDPIKNSNILGGTYKMYTGDMIHNFGKIASIQKAANLSSEYKKYFPVEPEQTTQTQRLYNYWAHSRYLLAIIGAYNAIYVTGSRFGSTANLLQKLLDSNKGIMGKRDSLLKSSGAQAVVKNIYLNK